MISVKQFGGATIDFSLKRSLKIRQFVGEISELESVNHQMKSEIVSLKTKIMEITEEHKTTMSLNTKTMNSIVKMHEEALGDKRNELANIKQELQRVNVTNQELLQKIQGFEKNQELEMDQNTFANFPQDPKDDPQNLDENLQDIALHSNVQDGKFKDKVNKDTTKIHLCTICKEFKSNNLYIFERHKKSCETESVEVRRLQNDSTEDPDPEKPFSCAKCFKRFKYANHLEIHDQIHTLYSCQKCKKDFSTKYLLKRHNLIHNSEKPHGTFLPVLWI